MTRILKDFEGLWEIRRQIEQKGSHQARFEGQAEYSPAPDGMLYKETGTLCIGTHPPMTATRQYFWDVQLNVYFEDGRFFHTVPPKGGKATHWCDPDQYKAQYDFSHWPHWSCIWKVKGPRKDYTMYTKYIPQ